MNGSINKIKQVAEEQEWALQINDKDYLFSKFSPAGQDFNIELQANDLDELLKELYDRISNYDCSEETYVWLDECGHGKRGAPYNMKDLYEDMEACLDMMEKLHEALGKIQD